MYYDSQGMIRLAFMLIVVLLTLSGCGGERGGRGASTETSLKVATSSDASIRCRDVKVEDAQVPVMLQVRSYGCGRARGLVRYFVLHDKKAPKAWYAANFGGCEWVFIPRDELHRLKIKPLDARWSKYSFAATSIKQGCRS